MFSVENRAPIKVADGKRIRARRMGLSIWMNWHRHICALFKSVYEVYPAAIPLNWILQCSYNRANDTNEDRNCKYARSSIRLFVWVIPERNMNRNSFLGMSFPESYGQRLFGVRITARPTSMH